MKLPLLHWTVNSPLNYAWRMILHELKTPQAAGGIEQSAATICDKRAYAARWQSSVRSVDNWLSQGCPHLKIGSRRVRINVVEADQWMRDKFSVQRRKVSTPAN